MRFTRVIVGGRRAYRQLRDEVLCYDPRDGVFVLPDSAAGHHPQTPRLWLGELPDDGWQHDLPLSSRSTFGDAEGNERVRRSGSSGSPAEESAEGTRTGVVAKGGRA